MGPGPGPGPAQSPAPDRADGAGATGPDLHRRLDGAREEAAHQLLGALNALPERRARGGLTRHQDGDHGDTPPPNPGAAGVRVRMGRAARATGPPRTTASRRARGPCRGRPLFEVGAAGRSEQHAAQGPELGLARAADLAHGHAVLLPRQALL